MTTLNNRDPLPDRRIGLVAPEAFPWRGVVPTAGVGLAIVAWDRWPINHGSGVPMHDSSAIGFLIAIGGLGLLAGGAVVSFRWLDAWVARNWSPTASTALRAATGIGLIFAYMFAAVSGPNALGGG